MKEKAFPLLRSKGYQISSYTESVHQYQATIPGLDYAPITDENLMHLNKTIPSITLFHLGDLLKNWVPDDVSNEKWKRSIAHSNGGNGVPRFDFNDERHMSIAERFKSAEIPFIVNNVPAVITAISNTFNLPVLLRNFGQDRITVDESLASNHHHFTYYKAGHLNQYIKTDPDWRPPQRPVEMRFDDFLYLTEKAEALGPIVRNATLHYFTLSAAEGYRLRWLREALPFFSDEESFFIVDPNGFKGINCRFGQKGVIAAAHYDSGRNFVVMLRGRKRYILLPPDQCTNLHLLPRGHPSSRHSALDWTNIKEMETHGDLWNSRATEVVLGPGDVLYIPAYWFHYIISQDASIQCNARSGSSDLGRSAIAACGFYDEKEQESGALDPGDHKNTLLSKQKRRHRKRHEH